MVAEVLTPKTLAGLKVQPVQERSQFYNILIYGDSGTGKTTFVGSADEVPALRPVLFIDIEGGTESLRHSYPDVEVVRVETWKEMQLVYDELHRGGHGYRTIGLDSLTEIQKFSMYQIMEDLKRSKPDADPDIPSMREWGKNIEQIRRFVRAFRDLPTNTIFTALAKTEKDSKTGMMHFKPYLSGKLADEVAGFLDIVTYYYVKQIDQNGATTALRLMLTQKTEQHTAKDRSGRLPMVLQNPTMKMLNEYMQMKHDPAPPSVEDTIIPSQLTVPAPSPTIEDNED